MATPLKSIRKKCLSCQENSAKVRRCEFENCMFFPFRTGVGRPKLKDIRKYCLWCCCESIQEVRLCPSDGKQSSLCPLHPYRFGKNPKLKGRTNAGSFKSRKHGREAGSAK